MHSVSEAESRKTEVRERILRLIGGLPDYAGPLNARVTGRIEKPSPPCTEDGTEPFLAI